MEINRIIKIRNRPRMAYIFEKGHRLRGRFMRFNYMPSVGKTSKFSLVISRKTGRTAVERNKTKRRVYEAIRLNLHHLPKTCYDIVVLVYPTAAKATYAELENEISYLLKKI